MSKPLDRAEMLHYVQRRLREVELESKELEGIDMRSKIFQLGVRVGKEAAYHSCIHMLQGWYGDDWTPETEGNNDDERRRDHTNT